MGKTTAPDPKPAMPTSGGSYVRVGDELQTVASTAPAASSVATEPGASDVDAADQVPAPGASTQE